MGFPQQGFRRGVGMSPTPSLTGITISNTLYVMKNGNNATALPNRLDKPFLTIRGAMVQANVGDTIYVFAGDYNEGSNDIIASDVYYYFEEGAFVRCLDKVISDFDTPKNIYVGGYGTFITDDLNDYVVSVRNKDSVINLNCSDINGTGGGILCAGTFNINVTNLITSGGRGIVLTGDICTGTIRFNNLSNVLERSIFVVGANSDLENRNIYIYGNEIISSSGINDYIIYFDSNADSRIYFNVNYVEETVLNVRANCMFIKDTYIFLNNSNFISGGRGIAVFENSVLYITNCNIKSQGIGIANLSATAEVSNIQINNTLIKSITNFAVFSNVSNSEISLYDCVIVSGIDVIFTSNLPIIRLKNCQLVSNDTVTVRYCILADTTPLDIYVYGQCSSNVAVGTDITNQVTGTNIVVDANIVENTNNFF